MYDQSATDYANAVFGEPKIENGRSVHSDYTLLNAEYLAEREVPVTYAAKLPWETSTGSMGYNFEDIDALYSAGVPAEWAAEFHEGLLGRWGRIEQWIRLHIDEMAFPIAVCAAGVDARYAALCVMNRLSADETIRLHTSVPYEYLGAVL